MAVCLPEAEHEPQGRHAKRSEVSHPLSGSMHAQASCWGRLKRFSTASGGDSVPRDLIVTGAGAER